ncbi:hypothetical protein HZA44_04440, partial [Candidatus Peregrinibacteria bacterium]|nr:hypothetical protein [Candidatus Peregrinibacteria bacterium]
IAGFFIAMLIPLAQSALAIFLGTGILFVVLGVYLLYKFGGAATIVGWAKALLSWTWSTTKETAKSDHPSMTMCVLGAIGVSGFLNSPSVSSADTYYLPSILLSIGGVVALVHKWYTHTHHEHAKDHFLADARKVLVKAKVLKPGAKGTESAATHDHPPSKTDTHGHATKDDGHGHPPAKHEAKALPAKTEEHAKPEAKALPAPEAIAGGEACPHCGASNRAGYKACGKCGMGKSTTTTATKAMEVRIKPTRNRLARKV